MIPQVIRCELALPPELRETWLLYHHRSLNLKSKRLTIIRGFSFKDSSRQVKPLNFNSRIKALLN